MKETEIPKKSGGIIGMLIGLLMFYAIVIGCYYGYKKYKESTLCKGDTLGLFIAKAMSNPNYATWMDNEMTSRGITFEQALLEFAMANEKIFKKGEPYDLSTALDPITTCAENNTECITSVRNSRVMNACKQNIGGFRLSTLYFGDGFYNYPIPATPQLG